MKNQLITPLRKLDNKRPFLTKGLCMLFSGLCLILIFPGCGEKEGEYYSVEEVESESLETEEPSAQPPTGDLGIEYATPDSWNSQGSSRMVKVGFVAGEPPMMTADITVSAFPGDVGGKLANVNRWRRQVGLGPLSENVLEDFVKPVEISGKEGWRVDFTGPAGSDPSGEAKRVVVAAIPHEEETWFFKMQGPESAVEDEYSAYMTFLESVDFIED